MLSHIPIWVFFLFGGLFVLGLWLGRPRAVSPRLQIIVAVGFLGYSLWGVISAFGIHPAAMLLWAFIRFQNIKSEMQSQMDTELADNPFRGLAEMAMQSVQLQWGWLPLVLGAALLVYAGLQARKTTMTDSTHAE